MDVQMLGEARSAPAPLGTYAYTSANRHTASGRRGRRPYDLTRRPNYAPRGYVGYIKIAPFSIARKGDESEGRIRLAAPPLVEFQIDSRRRK